MDKVLKKNSDIDFLVKFSKGHQLVFTLSAKTVTYLTILDKVLNPVEMNLHLVCMDTLRYVSRVLMGGFAFCSDRLQFHIGCYDSQGSVMYRNYPVTSTYPLICFNPYRYTLS